jgi:hypothetical protein
MFVATGMSERVIKILEGSNTEAVLARNSVSAVHMDFVELWLGFKAD